MYSNSVAVFLFMNVFLVCYTSSTYLIILFMVWSRVIKREIIYNIHAQMLMNISNFIKCLSTDGMVWPSHLSDIPVLPIIPLHVRCTSLSLHIRSRPRRQPTFQARSLLTPRCLRRVWWGVGWLSCLKLLSLLSCVCLLIMFKYIIAPFLLAVCCCSSMYAGCKIIFEWF